MKKEVILLAILFLSIAIFPTILADEKEQIELAYQCLNDRINQTGCNSMSFQEQVFSLLAVEQCEEEIKINNLSNECWPKGSCDIKSTAQTILALEKINENTTKAQNWLLTQTAIPQNLDWFLEIESNEATSCNIFYNTGEHTISVGLDKKINSNAGSCLTLAQDDYWLEINPSCYNMEIKVQCDKGFITTLLFKKDDSSTVHVSEDVHGASASGTTTEMVDALCFAKNGICNYEGSLWATAVLNKFLRNNDVLDSFMPYLIAMEPDNSNLLPESFLYSLTGKFRTQLLLKQKAGQYWQESSNRFYDTPLVLLAFQNEEPFEKTYSKNWLLRQDIQEQNGCWNNGNIRDTAFILYSVWPEYFTPIPDGPGGNGNTTICGNNILETGEQCDGTKIGSASCSTIGNDWTGTPSCDSSCKLNYTSCNQDTTTEPVCGNNILETGEQCDKSKFGDRSCQTLSNFTLVGELSCDSSCKLNVSQCYKLKKGNDTDDTKTCTTDSDCTLSGQSCIDGKCADNQILDCEASNYFCSSRLSCTNAGGEVLYDHNTCTGYDLCCTEEIAPKTCSDQNGIICDSDEVCIAGVESSATDLNSEQTCCTGGYCKVRGDTKPDDEPKTNTCKSNSGTCKSSCGSGEEQSIFYECSSSSEVCCIDESKSDRKGAWILWLLLVLILLAVLGIVFREKLRPLIMKIKSKFGKSKPSSRGPRRPGRRLPPRNLKTHSPSRPIPRRILPPREKPTSPAERKPLAKKTSEKKKPSPELDDVLKKLRDLGK